MQNDNIVIFNLWWCRNNYGAILTAYALQQIVKSLNYNSYLFDDIGCCNINFFGEKFKKEQLNTLSRDNSYKAAEELNKTTSCFITGSDQIFRAGLLFEKYSKYFLDFVEPTKKKIAFSASFGVDKENFLKETPDEVFNKVKMSLKSFDFVSVREKSGVEICKDLFDVDAKWVIDPVFIMKKGNYNKLIEDSTIDYKNKIVAYVLDTSREYKKTYKYLEKKYDKKVIETANSNISVENWLASIRDCDLFVTDSFHGMCYALIFNKPFICLANESRGRTRFDSICEMLGIENQCINSISEVVQRDCVFKVDYTKVNQRIEEEQQKGFDFLKKAFDATVTNTQEKIDARMMYLENRVCELEGQNNLSYQLKKYLWEKWLIFYHGHLPMPIKKVISFFWQIIKGVKNASRK